MAKRVSQHTLTKLRHLRREFAGSKYLRLHIDENEDELVHVYKKLRGKFSRFLKRFSEPICHRSEDDHCVGGWQRTGPCFLW